MCIRDSKWTLYILQHLFVRCHSFGELRRSIDGISDKVLSDNLKRLQSNEIICKSVTSDNPPRSYYSLTSLGKSLKPIIESFNVWGCRYLDVYKRQAPRWAALPFRPVAIYVCHPMLVREHGLPKWNSCKQISVHSCVKPRFLEGN